MGERKANTATLADYLLKNLVQEKFQFYDYLFYFILINYFPNKHTLHLIGFK